MGKSATASVRVPHVAWGFGSFPVSSPCLARAFPAQLPVLVLKFVSLLHAFAVPY